MKWSIPAKTFLLGEYAAITGAPAIVLTTSPCFELTLSEKAGLHGIHPASPAGRWWMEHGDATTGLSWHDPYQGCGGMGASSAQFLGAYLAGMHIKKKSVNQHDMLDAYLQSASIGEGLPPSGYDVLAQSLQACVYIDRQKAFCTTYSWPFEDVAFLLLHTGQKLATHDHLKIISLPSQMSELVSIVELGKNAFEQADSSLLVDAVNAYHQRLAHMNLVAKHSMEHIACFREQTDVLAVKGCGAMGSDVLLLLVPTKRQFAVCQRLSVMGWKILATTADLYVNQAVRGGCTGDAFLNRFLS